jgi:predicted porin
MYGGLRERTNLALVLAVVGLFSAKATPVLSADLGGDCCADLEERVAELEATTARKGNRKVSVTVSGWVNEAVFFWDDGTEKNAYVGTNAIEQSRFRFTGEAKIDKDWSAGYILEIGVQGHPSNQWNQLSPGSSSLNPNNQDNALLVRKSNWFIKSKSYGQVSVGLNGTATYHLLDDADPLLTRNVNDAEGAAIFLSQFFLRSGGQFIQAGDGFPLRWTDALRGFNNSTPGDSGRRNVVRYDTPTFHGFTGIVAWGEDDLWDAAVTYKGDWNGISVTARAGYGQSTDPGFQNGIANPVSTDAPTSYVSGGTTCISSSTTTASIGHFQCKWGGAAATIQHQPTGLFLYGGWGWQSVHVDDNPTTTTRLAGQDDSTVWFLQPGIERKFFPLGKTNIFAEYRHDDAGANPGKTLGANIDFWQGGIVQNIEAADTSLYVVYEHADGYILGNKQTQGSTPGVGFAPIGRTNLDAFQTVITGAKINF